MYVCKGQATLLRGYKHNNGIENRERDYKINVSVLMNMLTEATTYMYMHALILHVWYINHLCNTTGWLQIL